MLEIAISVLIASFAYLFIHTQNKGLKNFFFLMIFFHLVLLPIFSSELAPELRDILIYGYGFVFIVMLTLVLIDILVSTVKVIKP